MNEHDPTKGPAPADEEARGESEDEVRRLLERAGPRPPIPAEDLEAITAAARTVWRREVARRREDPEAAEPTGREPRVSTEEARETLTRYQRAVATPPDRTPAAVARVRPPASRRRRAEVAKQLLFAATVLLAIGFFWWLMYGGGEAPTAVATAQSVIGTTWIGSADSGGSRPLLPGESIPAGATLATASGTGEAVAGRASLRLPDGTLVRVDAGTVVRIDSATLLRLESGRIYVDSGEEGSGLTIASLGGTASDIGTRFTVRVFDPPVMALEVRVRDGAVEVERAGRRYQATAGEELVVRRAGDPERRPIDPWGPEWDWVLEAAAGFPIEGRTLGELLDWVTRETGWTIRWADPALAESAPEIVLHGGLVRLRPDRAPFAVLPGAGLEGELVESDSGTELVIRRRQNS